MYLKSISIQGFKSFAKKVNIDLSSQVTGVVGPNGSGKSNVAEAIRFVLGEQSMKGLRSKSGSDLIFKGSSHLSPLSRASVSIHLDNTNKNLDEKLLNKNTEMNDILINFINLDEIILTREIYSDGSSEYLINNTKVRLKDVQELLAIANISAAGHTIVNQGEADRILLSNNKERREMIEDALGLRIYHIRIKEGEKKLDKVKSHLQEIDLLRRENLPHLNSLKRQVKELEKREEEIESISKMLKIYFYKENKDIEDKKIEIENYKDIENQISSLENELINLSNLKDNTDSKFEDEENKELLNKINNEISALNEKLQNLDLEKNTIYQNYINLDLEKKFLEKKQKEIDNQNQENENNVNNKNYSILIDNLNSFEENQNLLWNNTFSKFDKEEYLSAKDNLYKINNNEKDFLLKIKSENNNENHISKDINQNTENNFSENISNIDIKLNEAKDHLNKLNTEREIVLQDLNIKKSERENIERESQKRFYQLDNDILVKKLEIEKLNSQKESVKSKTEIIKNKEFSFENLLTETSIILGTGAFKYKNFKEEEMSDEEKNIFYVSQYELLRKIERSKIKIEESGIINADDILEEYNTLLERDTFLEHEIIDLEKTRMNLENLIKDLKDTLLLDFNHGLQNINQNFNNYFGEIFPGGEASLSIEKPQINNNSKNLEDDIISDLDEEIIKEPGIEIAINLPQKKVKDLQMLSGGERALSSIALIFAMSSINHPPFMVLDETDAALDEANARKYGKMIRKLAERSKLLVITHNRETMNKCDVLYGVTVGAEGCSKLLSIKFDEATEFAK